MEVQPVRRAVRVLFVCAGNICRSPTAEALFRAHARRHAPQLLLEVDSAGTHGLHAGHAPDPRAQTVRAGGVHLQQQLWRMALCVRTKQRLRGG